jgi:ribosome-associated translation inhibitor RaiA
MKTRAFQLTDSLREYVEYRLAFALSLFQDRIHSVVVVLSDINGAKGGIDKRCQLKVRLRGLSELVIDETEADFQIAVNRAADWAKRALARRLRRVRGVYSERTPSRR